VVFTGPGYKLATPPAQIYQNHHRDVATKRVELVKAQDNGQPSLGLHSIMLVRLDARAQSVSRRVSAGGGESLRDLILHDRVELIVLCTSQNSQTMPSKRMLKRCTN